MAWCALHRRLHGNALRRRGQPPEARAGTDGDLNLRRRALPEACGARLYPPSRFSYSQWGASGLPSAFPSTGPLSPGWCSDGPRHRWWFPGLEFSYTYLFHPAIRALDRPPAGCRSRPGDCWRVRLADLGANDVSNSSVMFLSLIYLVYLLQSRAVQYWWPARSAPSYRRFRQ